jgi:Tfp pilus assembly protein PilP
VFQGVKKNVCRLKPQFLGFIFCGLLVAPIAAGEFQKTYLENTGSVEGLALQTLFRNDYGNRQDPFRPIKKRRSISPPSRKSRPEPSKNPPISTIKDPNLKLLGIIRGQYGHQAVIQVSPGERIFVRPGLELVRSGWIIKTISDREVLLEHLSTSTSGKGLSQSRTFILAFPTPGKSG